jgi:hypothetical protein
MTNPWESELPAAFATVRRQSIVPLPSTAVVAVLAMERSADGKLNPKVMFGSILGATSGSKSVFVICDMTGIANVMLETRPFT